MAKKKRIAQYDSDYNLLRVFDSYKEACNETGVSVSSIAHCVSKRYAQAGGFVWKAYESTINNSGDSIRS